MIIDQHELILNLHEVGRLGVGLQVGELLINFGLHELSRWFVFLNTD